MELTHMPLSHGGHIASRGTENFSFASWISFPKMSTRDLGYEICVLKTAWPAHDKGQFAITITFFIFRLIIIIYYYQLPLLTYLPRTDRAAFIVRSCSKCEDISVARTMSTTKVRISLERIQKYNFFA